MPDYPPGVEPAVRAAIAAKLPVGTSWNTDVSSLARAALDAAAPLLGDSLARKILAQRQDCTEPHHDQFPKPSCWQCGRNGAFTHAARIAAGYSPAPGEGQQR